MNKICSILALLTVILSCKTKKTASAASEKVTSITLSECPPQSKCTIEVSPNFALKIEIQNGDKPYYSLIEQPGTTVYRYEMAENQDQQYVDGGYREEIIFQLPSDLQNSVISGKELQSTNALFGVFCYCKGKAGYYRIGEGTISKSTTEIIVSIPALVDGQKVRELVFKLQ